MYQVAIKELDNGWLVKADNREIAILDNFDGSEEEYFKAIRDLLYEVLDVIKPQSKHNPYKIRIELIPQHEE